MGQDWICADCRSLNGRQSKRCYHCRVPRVTGELTAATEGLSIAAARASVTVLAQATRLGARYHRSWPIALLVIPLIVAATALDVVQTQAIGGLVRADGRLLADPGRFDDYARLAIASAASYLVSVLAWSTWIAVVVSNLPALVARWSSRGPLGAFLAPFIPVLWIRRPFSVVRETVGLLRDNAILAGLIVTAWWCAWLAAAFVPGILLITGGLAGPSATRLQNLVVATQIRLAFILPAAILAIAVVVIIEGLQRTALRRRALVLLVAEGSPV